MIDFYEITVNGITWEVSDYTLAGEGADARAYTSRVYDDVILLIFNKRKTYKYDWLDFLDLILGESEYEDMTVLVLPLLDHVSDDPKWFDNLWERFHRKNIKQAYPELVSYAKSDIDPQTKYWAEKLISFLDKYPKYKNGKYSFDIQSNNILSRNGEVILYDPIHGK